MRALRPDKLTLAALEATLELYRDGTASTEIPALAMLSATEPALQARAEKLCIACAEARQMLLAAAAAKLGVQAADDDRRTLVDECVIVAITRHEQTVVRSRRLSISDIGGPTLGRFAT